MGSVKLVKVARIGKYVFPTNLYYYMGEEPHKHVWVETQPDGNVKIGLDHYAAQPMIQAKGPHELPFLVDLPLVNEKIEQGKPFGNLESAKYAGPFYSPVSGTVVGVNEQRCARPPTPIPSGAMSAYGEGWLLIIKPNNFQEDLKQLVTGEAAMNEILRDLRALAAANPFAEEGNEEFKDGYVVGEL